MRISELDPTFREAICVMEVLSKLGYPTSAMSTIVGELADASSALLPYSFHPGDRCLCIVLEQGSLRWVGAVGPVRIPSEEVPRAWQAACDVVAQAGVVEATAEFEKSAARRMMGGLGEKLKRMGFRAGGGSS